MAFTVQIRPAPSTLLSALVSRLDEPLRFLLPWGQLVAREARETARSKGGRRFWTDLSRSVRVTAAGPAAASVASHHVAAAQKQFGGVIEAKNRLALTIPVADEAKGKRASEFEAGGRELFVRKVKRGDPGTIGLLGYSENDEFHALYVLRTRTRKQDPEPWFPDDARVGEIGLAEASRFIAGGLLA